MIDIHSHILPSIDDGCKNIEEAIKILKYAEENNVTAIVLTPHYILGSSYNADNKKKKEIFSLLKEKIKKENIDVDIYLGNEVYVENDLAKLLDNDLVFTLNNSNYLLYELPMNGVFNGVENVVFQLKCKNITSIIAHPERYSFLRKDPRLVEKLIRQGALFQSNIGSFLGYYGSEAKKLAILLLKHDAITFIASDIHNSNNNFYGKIEELKKVLSKYVDDQKIEDLLVNNSLKVINNETIESKVIKPFKKNIFGKWK